MFCVNLLAQIYRELVQLVERRSPKPDVVSSSLTFPAIMKTNDLSKIKSFFIAQNKKTNTSLCVILIHLN